MSINSLIVPTDGNFQEWYFSNKFWKFTLLAAAVELIRWFADHLPEDSINSNGDFSDSVREPLLDVFNINMATHGHFNTMVVPKLEMLKEYTRLISLGYNITMDTRDIMRVVDNALRMADSWRTKTKELEREIHGPHWGKAFDGFSWSEYLDKVRSVLN